MRDVEWLLRDAVNERSLRMGERAVIDDAQWHATIERIDLGAGLRVFLSEADVRRDMALEPRDNRTDE